MGYVMADQARRWPHSGMPYGVAKSVSADPSATKRLQAAVDAWNSRSALKLVHVASPASGSDHIWFEATEPGTGGISQGPGGRGGGRQVITMDYDWALAPTALLHEIGHAAGCIHEHQRPDRNQFVNVLPIPAENAKAHSNVDIRNDGIVVGPYDCLSHMHYTDDDPYVNPKPTACAKLANNGGMTIGDEWTMSFLAGNRLQGLATGKWGTGWTRFATFELGGTAHLVAYNGKTGAVHFDRVKKGGAFTETLLSGSWAKGWDVVESFEAGSDRLLMVYDQGTGAMRIDRVHPKGDGSATTSTGKWGTWTSIVSTGLSSKAKDHVLVYNAPTGQVRLDRVEAGGTTNLWQETWPKGFDSIMPYRIGAAGWHVLAYDRDTGRAEARLLASNGSALIFSPDWSSGWSHFVAIPNHHNHPAMNASFVAYNSVTGDVHLDHMHASSWSLIRADKWAPGWTHIFAPYLGAVTLGNTGLYVYNMANGAIHTHLVMPGT